jgi:3-polyprenyl-4-hydroxybenzoate decarboxylase
MEELSARPFQRFTPKPHTLEDMVDHTVGRVLYFEGHSLHRWHFSHAAQLVTDSYLD